MLVAFLRDLPPRKFDFDRIVQHGKRIGCGTVGCAVGWTPQLFPKLARWGEPNELQMVIVTGVTPNYRSLKQVAEHIYKLPPFHSGLFVPFSQSSVHPQIPDCSSTATPKQVARAISKYIELTETPSNQ